MPTRNQDLNAATIIVEDTGATMVEYSLVLAFVAFVAFLAVTAFGISVNGLIDNVDLLNALT